MLSAGLIDAFHRQSSSGSMQEEDSPCCRKYRMECMTHLALSSAFKEPLRDIGSGACRRRCSSRRRRRKRSRRQCLEQPGARSGGTPPLWSGPRMTSGRGSALDALSDSRPRFHHMHILAVRICCIPKLLRANTCPFSRLSADSNPVPLRHWTHHCIVCNASGLRRFGREMACLTNCPCADGCCGLQNIRRRPGQ